MSEGKNTNSKEITMIKLTNDKMTRKNSWNANWEATYKADHDITREEAEVIMKESYRTFPVTKASYWINGKTMTIVYVVDDCN